MAQFAFDTLADVKTLEAAGVKPTIAEAHTKAQIVMVDIWMKDQLATKQEIGDLRHEMTTQFQTMNRRMLVRLGVMWMAGVAVLGTWSTIVPHLFK